MRSSFAGVILLLALATPAWAWNKPQGPKPSREEIKKRLSPMQFQVTQDDDTEPSFKNEFWNTKNEGIYVDILSGEPLFASIHKYDSGTGWPSFWQSLPGRIGTKEDNSLFATRTEVHCIRCGGHFGHIFDDGPKPTGMRHCLNGAALTFRAA
jgi:methionine-R-sulfoxide reductase